MTTDRLTGNQLAVLEVADTHRLDGGQLLQRLSWTSSPEGFHQTAASLVRRGYLAKDRIGGIVYYTRTARGTERVSAEHSLTRLYGAAR